LLTNRQTRVKAVAHQLVAELIIIRETKNFTNKCHLLHIYRKFYFKFNNYTFTNSPAPNVTLHVTHVHLCTKLTTPHRFSTSGLPLPSATCTQTADKNRKIIS